MTVSSEVHTSAAQQKTPKPQIDPDGQLADPEFSSPLNSILALIYGQFDDVEGYVKKVSSPSDALTSQFADLGYYFLPDKQLSMRVMTLTVDDKKIISVPLTIADQRYVRKAFSFCFAAVIDSAAGEEFSHFASSLCENLTILFRRLELDQRALSSMDATACKSMNTFFDEIRSSVLNSDPWIQATVPFGHSLMFSMFKPWKCANPITGRTSTSRKDTGNGSDGHLSESGLAVYPYSIPVVVDRERYETCLARLKNISNDAFNLWAGVDGVKTIRAHATSSRLELDATVRIFSSILDGAEGCDATGVILLQDPIDSFTRVRLLPAFFGFFDSGKADAVEFCSLEAVSDTGNCSQDDLMRIMSSLDGNERNLEEFSTLHRPETKRIDVRKTVIYALWKRIARCKTMYPYCQLSSMISETKPINSESRNVNNESKSVNNDRHVNHDVKSQPEGDLQYRVLRLCDGATSLIAIADAVGVPPKQVLAILDSQPSVLKPWI